MPDDLRRVRQAVDLLANRHRQGGIDPAPGSIDKDALAKAILEHLGQVSRCYENAMTRNGESGGKLTLEWTVTTAGTVASAKVKNSSLKDGSIASCVLTALKGWRFIAERRSSGSGSPSPVTRGQGTRG